VVGGIRGCSRQTYAPTPAESVVAEVASVKTELFSVQLFRRPLRRFLAVTLAVASVAVLSASSAYAGETKSLTGEKNCRVPVVTVSPPAPGGYCLITESSLKILAGAKVYYTAATFVAGVLSSPVTLRATDRRESTATGHCTYHAPTATTPGHGLCVYWAGTHRLAGFHARLVVGPPTAAGFSIAGPYWFDRDDDNTDD
jgi:hypothetical protein